MQLTNDVYKLLINNARQLYVRLELLDENNLVINQLEGISLSGSTTIAANSTYRRVGNLEMHLADPSRQILDDKLRKRFQTGKIRVKIGLQDTYNSDFIYGFNLGSLVVSNADFTINATTQTVSLSLVDQMAFLDGSIAGTLGIETKIYPKNLPITEAIRRTVHQLGFIPANELDIVEIDADVPYEISKDPSSSIHEILKTLVDLYMGYEFFFDIDGKFKVQKIRDTQKDAIVGDFSQNEMDLAISYVNNMDLTNVKNSIAIGGRMTQLQKQIAGVYRNKYLRHGMLRNNYCTYDKLIVPFIYDQVIGDIVYINNILEAEEYFYQHNIDNTISGICPTITFNSILLPEQRIMYPKDVITDIQQHNYRTQLRQKRFFNLLNGKNGSYVGTNIHKRTEGIGSDETDKTYYLTTNGNGYVRLEFWALPDYDIVVRPRHATDINDILELQLVSDMGCLGETNKVGWRWYQVFKTNPIFVDGYTTFGSIGATQLESISTDYRQFKVQYRIDNLSDMFIYRMSIDEDGYPVKVPFAEKDIKKITNREEYGTVTFVDPQLDYQHIYIDYYAQKLPYAPYKFKDVIITYYYQLAESQGMELEFNVVPEFRIEEIGERVYSFKDDKITSNSQALLQAEYDLGQRSHFAEKVNLTAAPIYSLDVNQKIYLNQPDVQVEGEYLITQIDMPLEIGQPMQIQASKIFTNWYNETTTRVPPPLVPECEGSKRFYLNNMIDGYRYYNNSDIADKEPTLELESRPLGNVTYTLSNQDINRIINDFSAIIPNTDSPTAIFRSLSEKNNFITRLENMLPYVFFLDVDDYNEFILFSLENYKRIINQADTSNANWTTTESDLLLVSEQCHFLGNKRGKVDVQYTLGNGNTFERLSVFVPEKKPFYLNDFYRCNLIDDENKLITIQSSIAGTINIGEIVTITTSAIGTTDTLLYRYYVSTSLIDSDGIYNITTPTDFNLYFTLIQNGSNDNHINLTLNENTIVWIEARLNDTIVGGEIIEIKPTLDYQYINFELNEPVFYKGHVNNITLLNYNSVYSNQLKVWAQAPNDGMYLTNRTIGVQDGSPGVYKKLWNNVNTVEWIPEYEGLNIVGLQAKNNNATINRWFSYYIYYEACATVYEKGPRPGMHIPSRGYSEEIFAETQGSVNKAIACESCKIQNQHPTTPIGHFSGGGITGNSDYLTETLEYPVTLPFDNSVASENDFITSPSIYFPEGVEIDPTDYLGYQRITLTNTLSNHIIAGIALKKGYKLTIYDRNNSNNIMDIKYGPCVLLDENMRYTHDDLPLYLDMLDSEGDCIGEINYDTLIPTDKREWVFQLNPIGANPFNQEPNDFFKYLSGQDNIIKIDYANIENLNGSQGFVRRSHKLCFNGENIEDYEYSAMIKVTSHFCANAKVAAGEESDYIKKYITDNLLGCGVFNTIEYHEEEVYLGAVKTEAFPITLILALRDTAQKVQIVYRDLIKGSQYKENILLDTIWYEEPTKINTTINGCNFTEGNYSVFVRTYSRCKTGIGYTPPTTPLYYYHIEPYAIGESNNLDGTKNFNITFDTLPVNNALDRNDFRYTVRTIKNTVSTHNGTEFGVHHLTGNDGITDGANVAIPRGNPFSWLAINNSNGGLWAIHILGTDPTNKYYPTNIYMSYGAGNKPNDNARYMSIGVSGTGRLGVDVNSILTIDAQPTTDRALLNYNIGVGENAPDNWQDNIYNATVADGIQLDALAQPYSFLYKPQTAGRVIIGGQCDNDGTVLCILESFVETISTT